MREAPLADVLSLSSERVRRRSVRGVRRRRSKARELHLPQRPSLLLRCQGVPIPPRFSLPFGSALRLLRWQRRESTKH
jgi:hypothetical protein